jgi:hypothetical protein
MSVILLHSCAHGRGIRNLSSRVRRYEATRFVLNFVHHFYAAEFKPARPTRSETISLLRLEPIFAHALLAFSLLARLPSTIIPDFPARFH